MTIDNGLTLGDLGERRIVNEILPRFVSSIGDDCAMVRFDDVSIVMTTDPVPEPAAKLLGNDPDPYWMGWLLVTINASDLAAAGAAPLAFLAALEAPAQTRIVDFERLLLGIKESCSAQGLKYAGGNLREGPKLTGVGSAIGQCRAGQCLQRSGAQAGDIVMSIGRPVVFWRDVILIRSGVAVSKELSPVFRPTSQIVVMNAIAANSLVRAAIDNSDGLIASLDQFAKANRLSIRCDLDSFPTVERENFGIDSARLALGWGDWNVVVAAAPEATSQIYQIADRHGSSAIVIGQFSGEGPPVVLSRSGKTKVAPRLESERFAKDSWFLTGIEAYLDLLKTVELP